MCTVSFVSSHNLYSVTMGPDLELVISQINILQLVVHCAGGTGLFIDF